ncbi:MAG: c-type cytochrome [Bryobacteraceae bacterium]
MATSLHTCPGIVFKALLLICAGAACSFAHRADTPKLKLNTGKEIYEAACVACHGPDGKGMPKSTVGFEPPRTFPDFTRCDQTTPEMNSDWKAVIREGGEFRGFSQIMPSFRDALTSEQMDKVIHYVRGFCRDAAWPRGELNLPRAFATEKAYPENEAVVTTTLNAQGAPGVTNEIVHEQRSGVENQIEVSVPVDFVNQNHVWYGGFGDVALGLKRELFSNLRSGSILSFQSEAIFPTGNVSHGLGTGVTTFGVFAAFGQLLPAKSFVQLQVGSDLPIDTAKSPRTFFWRTALGKSFNRGHGLGRMWSPMVEMLSDRDLETGAKTNWDVLPEMQVTLSRRQHIRANAGVRIPVNNTAGRSMQVMFYLLWDWQDGRLTEGW